MSKFVEQVPAVTFDDVLLKPAFSGLRSRDDADTSWNLKEYKFHLPIVSANMDTMTEFKMAKKMAMMGGLGIIHRYMDLPSLRKIVKEWRQDEQTTHSPLCISLGSYLKDPETMEIILDEELGDMYCVDIAHGHSIHMKATLEYIKSRPTWESHIPVIAGNVATAEAARDLFDWGADVVKVGIGPGSVCTTRIKTGVGVPQLQAIMDCASVGPVIADGGIKTPGDAAKALAAGATAVMIGGLLAGTDCVPGWDDAMEDYKSDLLEAENSTDPLDLIKNGLGIPMPNIKFRGMASKEARADFSQASINAEGISTFVEARPFGSTEVALNDLHEGIKSAMSYTGSSSLDIFRKKAQFIKVTASTRVENSPHIKV